MFGVADYQGGTFMITTLSVRKALYNFSHFIGNLLDGPCLVMVHWEVLHMCGFTFKDLVVKLVPFGREINCI